MSQTEASSIQEEGTNALVPPNYFTLLPVPTYGCVCYRLRPKIPRPMRRGGSIPPRAPFISGSYGRWWWKNEEIDLIALGEESKTVWFGACKWSGRKGGTDVFQELRRKSDMVAWHPGKRKERFILFSRSGFTPSMLHAAKRENVVLVEGERVLR